MGKQRLSTRASNNTQVFLHDYPNKWERYLDWAEWCYNATQHSTTPPTPYEMVYRTPPLSISQYIPGASNLEAIEYDLTNRYRMLQELKQKLSKAQFRNELMLGGRTWNLKEIKFTFIYNPIDNNPWPIAFTYKPSKRHYSSLPN